MRLKPLFLAILTLINLKKLSKETNYFKDKKIGYILQIKEHEKRIKARSDMKYSFKDKLLKAFSLF